MSWRVRPATGADLPALLDLARLTGGGFTNLPADADALAARLALSDASFARAEDAPDDELYILLLEQTLTGRIGGCGMVFSRIGARWPFYSYKIGVLSQTSAHLGRTFALPFLNLVTDHDGASEVGGLFLHPDLRTGGLGKLLARSRYLFVAQHRARFADTMLAELRGVLDDDGHSPFWDALGAKFFGMSFPEADAFNAVHGSQFIADLMPKHPVYTALLPDAARAVIGQPHASGRGALAMLQAEGFHYDNYVDIFDGGPTVTARTDQLRTVRESRSAGVTRLCTTGPTPQGNAFTPARLAAGRLGEFRAWIGHRAIEGEGNVALPAREALSLGLGIGDAVRHVAI
ncbi:arginine N-succinyltransferase [Polymorphobacter fuscus]|uniref:Arginine N-succinyltransferase n=1 Tax=Sandarakinorhabdus fusca TaxID=1439888 RepID=A0A7C9GPD8_9SPHN|nr:arginine N-succinyltransferase [Polymorphobacter fuscus]KAB7647389.1 arginine N-succinyltransferase [Polymorphobacter fuscus]MQT16630.1 arginine N-succinyltransferase [Polymorphobacter fuscus]